MSAENGMQKEIVVGYYTYLNPNNKLVDLPINLGSKPELWRHNMRLVEKMLGSKCWSNPSLYWDEDGFSYRLKPPTKIEVYWRALKGFI